MYMCYLLGVHLIHHTLHHRSLTFYMVFYSLNMAGIDYYYYAVRHHTHCRRPLPFSHVVLLHPHLS